MKIYLHSDRAERQASYTVTVAPAADADFVSKEHILDEWKLADGNAKQIEVKFAFGVAEVSDPIGRYMIARGLAHRSRMLRKVFQLFDRAGEPIEEVFDSAGQRVMLDTQAAA